MDNDEKAICFNCNGTGMVPDMDWIKNAVDGDLDDPEKTCWIECPECHGTGYC